MSLCQREWRFNCWSVWVWASGSGPHWDYHFHQPCRARTDDRCWNMKYSKPLGACQLVTVWLIFHQQVEGSVIERRIEKWLTQTIFPDPLHRNYTHQLWSQRNSPGRSRRPHSGWCCDGYPRTVCRGPTLRFDIVNIRTAERPTGKRRAWPSAGDYRRPGTEIHNCSS